MKDHLDKAEDYEGQFRFAHGDVGAAIRDIAAQITLHTSGWVAVSYTHLTLPTTPYV